MRELRALVNRFKHLPRWSWEIENKGKFRGSSCWHNTAARHVGHRQCVLATHNLGGNNAVHSRRPKTSTAWLTIVVPSGTNFLHTCAETPHEVAH